MTKLFAVLAIAACTLFTGCVDEAGPDAARIVPAMPDSTTSCAEDQLDDEQESADERDETRSDDPAARANDGDRLEPAPCSEVDGVDVVLSVPPEQ